MCLILTVAMLVIAYNTDHGLIMLILVNAGLNPPYSEISPMFAVFPPSVSHLTVAAVVVVTVFSNDLYISVVVLE